MTVRYMRIACWTFKATNTHFEYAFPLQQWLHVKASILRYTYIILPCICVGENRDVVVNEDYRVCCEGRNRSSIIDGKNFSGMLHKTYTSKR
jgi:hypothetical protein